MNIQECDILRTILTYPYMNQRALAHLCNHSLGIVNRSLKSLIQNDYLTNNMQPTQKALDEVHKKAPKNAIILAAGFGMRMVPINLETPKALLEVNEEPLIERIIHQLHEVGIEEIYIVVGFMKESLEYLIDEYHVHFIINDQYATKNNLYSMKLALPYLGNSYIIPCDIWCDNNPFHSYELYSWYMVSDVVDDDSSVRVNRKNELVTVQDDAGGNEMIGISYILESDAAILSKRILELSAMRKCDGLFWEAALYDKKKMIINANVVSANDVVEINTYEQLRDLDSHSDHVNSLTIQIAAEALHAKEIDIQNIEVLKKGMTNRSFLFQCKEQSYIMRIPGEGTDQLINRRQEALVYNTIKDQHLCDDLIYMNPDNGYKITRYFNHARVCDPTNMDDVARCMKRLKGFHNLHLQVPHTFDIFHQIDFYESLWNGLPSAYRDYNKTKEHVLSLQTYINQQDKDWVLTHIDAVADNFLFIEDEDGSQDIRLIDWEYAGMQDPHVDIAMFAIYALYDKEEIDQLIDLYFDHQCEESVRTKIYCYISACGLLWSNWCEYKRHLGVEFREYSIKQYRYAKEFYQYASKRMQQEETTCIK